jgi:hypothetical protein
LKPPAIGDAKSASTHKHQPLPKQQLKTQTRLKKTPLAGLEHQCPTQLLVDHLLLESMIGIKPIVVFDHGCHVTLPMKMAPLDSITSPHPGGKLMNCSDLLLLEGPPGVDARRSAMTKRLLQDLRKEVEAQYHEALHAIDVLEKYMQQTDSSVLSPGEGRDQWRSFRRPARTSQRQLVLDVLRRCPGAGIDDLARETGLDKQQVRGVLYAPEIAKGVKRELTSDGLARYTLIQPDSTT